MTPVEFMHGGTVWTSTSSNFHPYECDGAGKCVHCDRELRITVDRQGVEQTVHDPATCALCDPEYDMAPNPHWPTGKQITG